MADAAALGLTQRTDLRGRSLISMRSHTPDEIELLLDTAAELKQLKRDRVFPKHLADRNIAIIFLKPSTRTRMAFVIAASDEGAHTEVFRAEDMRFGVKESVKDIARVLGRTFDGIAFRGFGEGDVRALADHSGVPVWNALTENYHPTQVLADMLTIRELFGTLDGAPVTYVGDGRNNVVRSWVIGAVKMGMDFRILAPRELQPAAEEIAELTADDRALGGRITVTDDPRQALEGSAVVYSDVWVSMGEEDLLEQRIGLLRDYRVTSELMSLTGRDDTAYLHCLPAYHDFETEMARAHPDLREVDDDVFEGPRSHVFDQSENRMHTAKALMVLTVG
jgi:ornithine carbamoyltransferase